jgi:hypothetical protein
MIVPGSNVLNLALRAIRAQPVALYRFTANVGQPNGVDLPTYTGPVPVLGSVQPLDQKATVELGLDWNKKYVKLFTSVDIHDVARDSTGDVFTFGGRWFSAVGQVDWIQMDGWNEILSVQIPPLGAGQIIAP